MIGDRYVDSTVAYQGGARGLGHRAGRGAEPMAHRRPVARRHLPARRRAGDCGRRAAASSTASSARARSCSARSRRPTTSWPSVTRSATCGSMRSRPPEEVHADVLARRAGASVIEALEHQPRARIALEAALRDDARALARLPLPRARGQRQARGGARVRGGADLAPAPRIPRTRARRVLSGVHPDLTWVEPRGAHDILVDDVRDADRAPGGAAARSSRGGACS